MGVFSAHHEEVGGASSSFREQSRFHRKLNEMKCITTPFLSGLCYGPVHVGFYDPWTFVGLYL